jgi:hypothetical protein
MITKTLRTTTGKIKVTIPSLLSEVTFGHLMALQDKPSVNDLEAISILSGVPLSDLRNISNIADLEIFNDTIVSLTHQMKHLYDSEYVPKTITFKKGEENITISVINNLSVEPVGAFMAAREIIAEEINGHIIRYGEIDWKETFNPSLKACCQVLAHYFYCRATGNRYNEYEAEEFCSQIEQLRVTEALPIAKHFFTCYPGLSKPKISCCHRLLQFWKSAPGYIRSKSLNISTR